MAETLEEKRRRVLKIIGLLEKEFPDPRTELNYTTPLELLVAVMLSAQATDKGVNKATPALFKRYRTAEDYANADLDELIGYVKSINYNRTKAKNIKNAARMLVEKYGSQVPKTMAEMITLPGVARKTANVVLGSAYGLAEGIAVDTHVTRVTQRLGLTDEKDPKKIEQDLMKVVPKERWIDYSHLIILLGRRVCTARDPQHEKCPVNRICPSAFKI